MYIVDFLPLKIGSCMSHFGTCVYMYIKMIRLSFFSAQAGTVDLDLYRCIARCLFFFFFFFSLQAEVSVNAQEQTASTRLQLQTLLLTPIRMEPRRTEAHRKVKQQSSNSCLRRARGRCISFSVSIGRQFTVFKSNSVLKSKQKTHIGKDCRPLFSRMLCTLMLDTLTQLNAAPHGGNSQ